MSRAALAVAIVGCALAGIAAADDDPMAMAEIRTGRPSGIKCPDTRPCVVDHDGAYFVLARSWKRYYVLDHTDPKSALRAGSKDAGEVAARVDAAVRTILEFHAAKKAAIQCGAAGSVPTLVGGRSERAVKLPRTKPAATAPTALTPAQADAAWLAARAGVDDLGGEIGDRVDTLFAGVDTSAMTADTFTEPRARSVRASVIHRNCKAGTCDADQTVEAHVIVIYSPESKRVYLVDRSVKLPTTQWRREADKRTTADQDAAFAALAALKIKTVVVDPDSLCAMPRIAGKNGWFELK